MRNLRFQPHVYHNRWKMVWQLIRNSLLQFWQSGTLQAISRQLLIYLHFGLIWYVTNAARTVPGTIGGLLALFMARLFDTEYTRIMFSALGLHVSFFYLVAITFGVLLGAGIIEFRGPDRRG